MRAAARPSASNGREPHGRIEGLACRSARLWQYCPCAFHGSIAQSSRGAQVSPSVPTRDGVCLWVTKRYPTFAPWLDQRNRPD
jgi:hypothetical protein